MTKVDKLKNILIDAWSKETCSPGLRNEWSKENPSLGQCAVTALIVNDFFGGEIMRCMASSGSHYYNMIDNELVDLTKEQFLGEEPLYDDGKERTREYLLGNEDTKKRYLLLKKNLLETNKMKLIHSETMLRNLKEVQKESIKRYLAQFNGKSNNYIYAATTSPTFERLLKLQVIIDEYERYVANLKGIGYITKFGKIAYSRIDLDYWNNIYDCVNPTAEELRMTL
jgi:histone deacetylase complex regulatory component SIN3